MNSGEDVERRPADEGGDVILAHHPDSLFELRFFGDLGHILHDPAHPAHQEHHVRHLVTRPGGWHVLDLGYSLPEGGYWLTELVAGSRAPAMIFSFFNGEMCAIRGLEPGPHATPWAVRLHDDSVPSRYPVPKHRDLFPRPLPPEWMIADDLLSGTSAVEAVAGWSAAAGGRADRAALTALLAERPGHFTKDIVSRLADTLGLGERVELWYPHELVGWDDPVKLQRSIAALQPGRFRALDCVEHQNCFALVRMRDDGDYAIEYREPKSEAGHQTVTPSLDAVVEAMTAWARGEVSWREDFEWTQIAPVIGH